MKKSNICIGIMLFFINVTFISIWFEHLIVTAISFVLVFIMIFFINHYSDLEDEEDIPKEKTREILNDTKAKKR